MLLYDRFVLLSQAQGAPLISLVFIVYFCQGLRFAMRLAVTYTLRDVVLLDPPSYGAVLATAGLPWAIKPVFGVATDVYPLFGYHRTSYLIVSGVVSLVAEVLFASAASAGPSGVSIATVLLVVSSCGSAVADVVIDAMIAEATPKTSGGGDTAADLQALSRVAHSIGGLLGSLVVGVALSSVAPQRVLLLGSGASLVLIVSAAFTPETPVAPVPLRAVPERVRSHLTLLMSALKRPQIWRPLLWYFCSLCVEPSLTAVMIYYKSDRLGFSPLLLSAETAMGMCALAAGSALYTARLRHVSIARVMTATHIATAALCLATLVVVTGLGASLGIPPRIFMIGENLTTDVVRQLKGLPFSVFAARACPPGTAGTLFALFMAVLNLGDTVSSYHGALLSHLLGVTRDDYSGMWLLVILRTIGLVLPIAFVGAAWRGVSNGPPATS